MARYKRQMWTSGYTYRQACTTCGTVIEYTDNQLGYRSWYPNGFVYCPRCRKPVRHNEFFAVNPDGTPVYKTQMEADLAVRDGYFNAIGVPPYAAGPVNQPQGQGTPAPSVPAVPGIPVAPDAPAASAAQGETRPRCDQCGREYTPGYDHFCTFCGKKLD